MEKIKLPQKKKKKEKSFDLKMVVLIYLFARFYNKAWNDYPSEIQVIFPYSESSSFQICRGCIINFSKNRLVELCDNSPRLHVYK